jgi:hypothetical protein
MITPSQQCLKHIRMVFRDKHAYYSVNGCATVKVDHGVIHKLLQNFSTGGILSTVNQSVVSLVKPLQPSCPLCFGDAVHDRCIRQLPSLLRRS